MTKTVKSNQLSPSHTVTQHLTVANTVGTHKKMHEKTLTSLLFVYCVNMATGLPAKSLFEGSGQGTQRGG